MRRRGAQLLARAQLGTSTAIPHSSGLSRHRAQLVLYTPTPHVYPEGDWRNDALKASLSDEGRVHREARGRNCTYALTIAYDGEAYLGFQYQPKGKTVQDEVEKALSKLTGEDREFIGLAASGRTDTGVHARGQVVHFYTREPFQDLARAHRSLNGILPKDIRVTEIRRPHPAFRPIPRRAQDVPLLHRPKTHFGSVRATVRAACGLASAGP